MKVNAIEAELDEQGIIVQYQRIPREENEEADLLNRFSEEELEQLSNEVFRISRVLILDNGKQFNYKTFKDFTRNMGIWHKFSSVAHLQTNGWMEVTNRAILQGLENRLDGVKKNWAAELNSILWAFRTTPQTPTKETPFALAFGTETVVPIELQIPSHCVQFNNEDTNDDKLRSNLDALEEIKEEAQVHTAAYQQKATRYYNQKVKERSRKEGDLALRKLEATGKRATVEKVALTWEGSFRITKVVKPGVYQIEDLQGYPKQHAWNIQHLKRYFP
ncbi:uncharacterized protein LOC110606305 [Manihot esculenta]|uniref:uncharacterized protein LOC110606305 n=1 Tax=Manihot esculenta TaxID=3983 RepID=UPI000B5D206E|nr:uncharacterized protein LOC110606305 [Manihot esculenta]